MFNNFSSFPFQACVLSGARNAKNAVIAEKTTRRMQELFPEFKNDLIAADILLANTLASTGDFDKSSSIRWKLSQNGSKKKPGLSWTEVHGELVVSDFKLD